MVIFKLMGIIYLILSVDDLGNEKYKIGVTERNIEVRIRELQTGNSDKLRVLSYYETLNYLKVERMLHRKFSVKTSAGNEWRNLTNEEVMSFKLECKKYDAIINSLKDNPFFN